MSSDRHPVSRASSLSSKKTGIPHRAILYRRVLCNKGIPPADCWNAVVAVISIFKLVPVRGLDRGGKEGGGGEREEGDIAEEFDPF